MSDLTPFATGLIDSLPYVDDEYEKYEQQVNALIHEEVRRFLPRNYLEALPEPRLDLQSEILREGLDRAKTRTRVALDLSKYDLAIPAAAKGRNDPAAWQEALQNAQAMLEHQSLRLANLELAETYGANAWRLHNEQLESVAKRLEAQLAAIRQQIEQINIQRKSEQDAGARTLRPLMQQYDELIRRNNDIEAAIAAELIR